MRVDFEPEHAQQLERPLDLGDLDTAIVRIQNGLVKGLNAHLHLRASKAADHRQRIGGDGVRPRFHHKTNHAATGGFVLALQPLELIECGDLLGCDGAPRRTGTVVLGKCLVVRACMLVQSALDIFRRSTELRAVLGESERSV